MSYKFDSLIIILRKLDNKEKVTIDSLKDELTLTENRISFARQLYNDLVANYRMKLGIFSDKIIASAFGFDKVDYYSIEDADREVLWQI